MKPGWFKEIAMTICLALPCTMLSAAHGGEHMAETRASMAQENINSMAATSVNAQAVQRLELAFHNTEAGTPIKMVHVFADFAMSFASLQMSMLNMQIAILKGTAQEHESFILMNQAETTEFNEQIQLANAQLNEVFSVMNSSITTAGGVLANMSNLSGETLGQLHGASN